MYGYVLFAPIGSRDLLDKLSNKFSRTYAPKIAELPRKMSHDHETATFRLQYMPGSSAPNSGTTIFFSEAMNYCGGYEVHAINLQTQNVTNQPFVFTHNFTSVVDVTIVRPYSGDANGVYKLSHEGAISWTLADTRDPGFELRTDIRRNPGKSLSLRIYGDDGFYYCTLGPHGQNICPLNGTNQHDFLFSYTIEVWKAYVFGILPVRVDTIKSNLFGPLLGKKLRFTWVDDNFVDLA